MRDFLRRVFVEDAPLKLVSFFLALALFLLRSDWENSLPAYVRVQYIHPQDRMVTSDLVSEVKVTIRGPWNRTNRFNESELDPIQIDLSKREEGELRFTEDMVRLPPGLRVSNFTPASVYINLEPKVERTLDVQTVTEGEPAEGYRVSRISFTPRTVRVVGAKAAVEAMRNAPTRPIRVTDLRSPVSLPVKLAPPPRFVRFLDSQDIAVVVEVQRSLMERTYTDVQVSVTGAAHATEVELSPAKVTVVLRGPALALEGLSGTPEAVVDASSEERKPPGTYRKRVQVVNLQPDVAAEVRPDAVHMTLGRPK